MLDEALRYRVAGDNETADAILRSYNPSTGAVSFAPPAKPVFTPAEEANLAKARDAMMKSASGGLANAIGVGHGPTPETVAQFQQLAQAGIMKIPHPGVRAAVAGILRSDARSLPWTQLLTYKGKDAQGNPANSQLSTLSKQDQDAIRQYLAYFRGSDF
jgi:hypothetical protein